VEGGREGGRRGREIKTDIFKMKKRRNKNLISEKHI